MVPGWFLLCVVCLLICLEAATPPYIQHICFCSRIDCRYLIQDLNQPDINHARNLKLQNPHLNAVDIAKQVPISDYQRGLLAWMQQDLEQYHSNHFDDWFDQKLAHATRYDFTDEHDFRAKFVGDQSRHDFLDRSPTADEDFGLRNGGQLFVDSANGALFNSALQKRENARENVARAITTFKEAQSGPLSVFDLTRLVALFARPENDATRSLLQLFPQGDEEDDASIGSYLVLENLYPVHAFFFVVTAPELDTLSFSFGQRVHYLGLISHGAVRHEDGLCMVGPACLLSQHLLHLFVTIVKRVNDDPNFWKFVHRWFDALQQSESDPIAKATNSLVYYFLTYKNLVRNILKRVPLVEIYRAVEKRAETEPSFALIKSQAGDEWKNRLSNSFNRITSYFESQIR